MNDLQSEAENIANLVTTYQINGIDQGSIEELQNSWAKEKQILLEAVKALRELVAKASNVAAVCIYPVHLASCLLFKRMLEFLNVSKIIFYGGNCAGLSRGFRGFEVKEKDETPCE